MELDGKVVVVTGGGERDRRRRWRAGSPPRAPRQSSSVDAIAAGVADEIGASPSRATSPTRPRSTRSSTT